MVCAHPVRPGQTRSNLRPDTVRDTVSHTADMTTNPPGVTVSLTTAAPSLSPNDDDDDDDGFKDDEEDDGQDGEADGDTAQCDITDRTGEDEPSGGRRGMLPNTTTTAGGCAAPSHPALTQLSAQEGLTSPPRRDSSGSLGSGRRRRWQSIGLDNYEPDYVTYGYAVENDLLELGCQGTSSRRASGTGGGATPGGSTSYWKEGEASDDEPSEAPGDGRHNLELKKQRLSDFSLVQSEESPEMLKEGLNVDAGEFLYSLGK